MSIMKTSGSIGITALLLIAVAPVARASVFTNPGTTPSQSYAAWPLDEITSSNQVKQATSPPKPVTPAPLASLSGVPAIGSRTTVGLISAYSTPNFSQSVPDCPPPAAPTLPARYGCYVTAGSVKWSGWDNVSGGTCAGGGAGGWVTTPASYVCPAQPSCPTGTGWTGGYTWNGSAWVSQCSYQAKPSCATSAGWTNGYYWTGSGWGGQCNYQAQPSCPSGSTNNYTWNGSGWTGGCRQNQFYMAFMPPSPPLSLASIQSLFGPPCTSCTVAGQNPSGTLDRVATVFGPLNGAPACQQVNGVQSIPASSDVLNSTSYRGLPLVTCFWGP